jgi:hypothetical protein
MADILGFEYAFSLNMTSAEQASIRDNVVQSLLELPDGNVELIPIVARSYTGSNVCNLQKGFYTLYVYCDIAEHVVVGDVKAPLLRTVNIAGNEGTMVNRVYETVQYVPVQKKQFDTIEIDIRDDAGRKVPFQRGRVIVTLHFRLKKPSYF